MFIKLRIRTNKIPQNGLKVMDNEFIIFVHVSEFRYGKPKKVSKEEFIAACPVTNQQFKEYGEPTTFDGMPIDNFRWMVKDPSCCPEDEQYHYNIVEWKNDKTKEVHRLTLDTIIFLLDDNGKTIEKIMG